MANIGGGVQVKFVCGDRKIVEMLPVPLNFQQILNRVVNLFDFQGFCLHFRSINILVPLNNETDLEYIWHLFQLRKDRKQRFDLLVTPIREDGSVRFGDDSADEFHNSSISEIQSCDFYPDYEDGEADGVPEKLRRHQASLTRALSSPQSSIGSNSAASSGSVSSNNIAGTAAALLGANSSPPNPNTSRTGGLFIPEVDDDVYYCETPRSGYAASISGGSYNSLISNSSSVQNISSHNNPDAVNSPPLVGQYDLPKRLLDENMHGGAPKWPTGARNGGDAVRGSNDSRNRKDAQFFFSSAVLAPPFSGSHLDFLPDTEVGESALLYSSNNDDHNKVVFDGDSTRYSGNSLCMEDDVNHDFNSRANAVGLTVVTNDLNQKTPFGSSSRDTLTGGGNSSCSARSHGTYPRAKNDSCETVAGILHDEMVGSFPNFKSRTTSYARSGAWNAKSSVYSRKIHGASSDINLSHIRTGSRTTSTPIYEATSEHINASSLNLPDNSSRNGHLSRFSHAGVQRTNNKARKEELVDTSGISSGTASDFSDDVNSSTSGHAVNGGGCEVDTVEDMKQWVKGKPLGSGAFGTVRQYYNKENGVERAVKEVQMTERTPERTLTAAQNEIHCLTQLSHERIVKFCGTGVDDYKILIFMELMPGGSVKNQLDEYGPLTESVCRRYLVQILDGLIYLHNAMVIHRDLKCANILRDGNGNVKLSDFGCAKMLTDMIRHSGSVNSFSCVGSPYWMSPEVILNERYTRKADIWSLGCTVVEMVTGKPPNSHREPLPAMYNLVAAKSCNPEFPKDASQGLTDFVTQALTFSQHSRPSATDLRHHQFLKGLQQSRSSTK